MSPITNDASVQPGGKVSHAAGGMHTTGPGASVLASILRKAASSGEAGLFS